MSQLLRGLRYHAAMKVERLTKTHRDEAVETLVAAFWDYPVMRFVLGDTDRYPAHIRAMIGLYADMRFARDWPVLGVRKEGKLAGVALISDPETKPLPAAYAGIEERLRATIGEAAWQRMLAFENQSDGLEPKCPHYFVGMLGVLPEYQGTGLSRLIMDEANRISSEDPRSEALCLSTESPGNLPYYEHLGFNVVGDADVGALHTWALIKPTP